jgi:hypothetical protein
MTITFSELFGDFSFFRALFLTAKGLNDEPGISNQTIAIGGGKKNGGKKIGRSHILCQGIRLIVQDPRG